MQNHDLEGKKFQIEILKLQRDYGFDNTMVFKKRNFVEYKHPSAFKIIIILENLSICPMTWLIYWDREGSRWDLTLTLKALRLIIYFFD